MASEPANTDLDVATSLDDVIKKLAETSLSGLMDTSATGSEIRIQHDVAYPISLIKKSSLAMSNLMPTVTRTPNEELLLTALQEAEAANAVLKERLIHSQAANILNEMYCAKLRGQLAHQEEKKKTGQKKGKILGDGLPRLLSGDAFFHQVVEHEEAQKQVIEEKKTRVKEWSRHAEAPAEWKRQEEERKARNNVLREQHRAVSQAWTEKKAQAKAEKTKFTEKRPTLGKLPGPIPCPKLVVVEEEVGSDGEEIDLSEDGASNASGDE
ncbi:hypothetical protein JVT61DRAFT_3617 [Boletus reticuloceps]|uniref:Uncharacterized protein n=1 Tax=Boletus reticuloceps TaxID=495285 RepID=A0A8I3A7P1_9AGAM|nr:hypothetical protein JVT61DRAFT_3617 [Boletus reticuloceps]